VSIPPYDRNNHKFGHKKMSFDHLHVDFYGEAVKNIRKEKDFCQKHADFRGFFFCWTIMLLRPATRGLRWNTQTFWATS
jgi:hypothetical protein